MKSMLVLSFGLLFAVSVVVFAQEDDAVVPMVTPEQACVPPEDIVFDTFTGGYIPFSQAEPDDILRLRDAIPPIEAPKYETAESASWLPNTARVIGYVADEQAYAYPYRILNFHEIINEDFNNTPILISYCPLCGSGIVFSRELDGQVLTFGNTSALYESDMVMYDHQTGSYWHQVAGEGIVGEYCNQGLDVLPTINTTWQRWKELHPDTLVLSEDTGFDRPYERDPFAGYQSRINGDSGFFFPVSPAVRQDNRLPPGEWVVSVEVQGQHRAYPPEQLGEAVIHDQLRNQEIVIFSSGSTAAAYLPGTHQFTLQAGTIRDQATGSEWSLAGEAIAGELAGEQLTPLPTRTTFWFALVAAFPKVEVYNG